MLKLLPNDKDKILVVISPKRVLCLALMSNNPSGSMLLSMNAENWISVTPANNALL